MPVPVGDLKTLLESDLPDATLVLVEGGYVVAGREELAADELRGALPVVTRDELLERVGERPVTDHELDEIAATLNSAVDNLGG